MRRALAAPFLAALAAATLTACGDEPTAAIAEAPLCASGDGDADAGNGVILMAQSVPTATWVPCIRSALPLGWGFAYLEARNGFARFWLDSDRDGVKAVEVRLTATCDTAGATRIPSDREGMERLERVGRTSPTYVGERYYVFEGGCLTVGFALRGESAGEALALASQVVGAVTREDLEAQVLEQSRGRLHLDAEEGNP